MLASFLLTHICEELAGDVPFLAALSAEHCEQHAAVSQHVAAIACYDCCVVSCHHMIQKSPLPPLTPLAQSRLAYRLPRIARARTCCPRMMVRYKCIHFACLKLLPAYYLNTLVCVLPCYYYERRVINE